MGFVRLVVFGFLALSVVYLSIALYSRSVRKERLEDAFDEANPDGEEEAREVFVNEGMDTYNKSIRPKLIGLVYVVPVVAVTAITYFINAN